jgi:hypothetical protein
MNGGKVLRFLSCCRSGVSTGSNLGTEPAHLLGALLITACAQAAEARRRMLEHERCRAALKREIAPVRDHNCS